jgi:hypothetical protein
MTRMRVLAYACLLLSEIMQGMSQKLWLNIKFINVYIKAFNIKKSFYIFIRKIYCKL